MPSYLKTILCGLILSTSIGLAQAVEAPEFSLKDSQGNQVSLADYKGKVLILHFWATWCPYCKSLQPGLEALYQKYQAEGVELLAISWWEDEGAQPQKVLLDRGHTFLTLIEGDEVANLYGVKATPTTFFIGRDGQVLGMTRTADPDDPKLEEAIRILLKQP